MHDRVFQSRCLLERLRQRMEVWFNKRRDADSLDQYATQRRVLTDVLRTAIGVINDDIEATATANRGDVYAACRRHDQRIYWLERVWRYFRDKFDQRDDVKVSQVLRAADEVVWSCYQIAFRGLPGESSHRPSPPTPLPYIEPLFSPEAIPRSEPPPGLRSGADTDFVKLLQTMPIPLISLPPHCLDSPCWLTVLAHEVGHHVQYDMLSHWGVFDQHLKELVRSCRPTTSINDESRWGGYGRELFADAFSIFNVGPSAIWVAGEITMGPESSLLANVPPRYPCPAVRLAFVVALAKQLGLRVQDLPIGVDVDGLGVARDSDNEQTARRREEVRQDQDLARQLARRLATEPIVELGPLASLCQFNADDYQPGSVVERWADGMSGLQPLEPEPVILGARRAVSGAVTAWLRASSIPDDTERARARATIARPDVWEAIIAAREPGTREAGAVAGQQAAEESTKRGMMLAKLLLDAQLEPLSTL